MSLGSEPEDMQEIIDRAAERLGAPWGKLRRMLPSPTTMTATIPAPPWDDSSPASGDHVGGGRAEGAGAPHGATDAERDGDG